VPVAGKSLVRPDVLRPHLAAFPLPESIADVRPKIARWSTLLSSTKAEPEINERTYRLFHLTNEDIILLQREVEL
jgi:hypothetical protein